MRWPKQVWCTLDVYGLQPWTSRRKAVRDGKEGFARAQVPRLYRMVPEPKGKAKR